jgi:hypothetical protein
VLVYAVFGIWCAAVGGLLVCIILDMVEGRSPWEDSTAPFDWRDDVWLAQPLHVRTLEETE